jgi:hypothetical protein
MTSFIRFKNYLRLQVPDVFLKTNSLWKPNNHPQMINYEELSQPLRIEFAHSQILINSFDRKLNSFSKVGPMSTSLKSEIDQFAYFSRNGYDFHPWTYLKKKNLTSLDVFSTLVDSNPFGLGVCNYQIMTSKDIHDQWKFLTDRTESNWVFLDYWNGIGLKMSIPKDLQALSDEELSQHSVDYKRYDDRNTISFAEKISIMSSPKFKTMSVQIDPNIAIELGIKKTIKDWEDSQIKPKL